MGTDLLEERSVLSTSNNQALRAATTVLWPAAAEVLRRGLTTRLPAAARAAPVNTLRHTQALRPPRMKAQDAILPSQRHATVKSDKICMRLHRMLMLGRWVGQSSPLLCQCPNGNRKRGQNKINKTYSNRRTGFSQSYPFLQRPLHPP